jgi:hypothetical protein
MNNTPTKSEVNLVRQRIYFAGQRQLHPDFDVSHFLKEEVKSAHNQLRKIRADLCALQRASAENSKIIEDKALASWENLVRSLTNTEG